MVDTRRLIAKLIVVAVLVGTLPAARAVLPDEVMSDPAREARARALSQELRCMVCQNQSIDDSEAPLARDLRLLVRERIASGDSDAQVIDFLVARYGEFVLLRPRFERQTLLLWLVPPLVLFGGGLVLWLQARRRKQGASEVPVSDALTAEEQARLKLLMVDGTVSTVSAEKGSEAKG
jgi:cytochrome c-type biogenesis protein CcmH